ncbi:hypothetical protein [Colwellia sp. UCD-KL20]|uniref:ligand-binding sensor domain-containing protein n=1 Tax=Colwellia sp. UCD-KL20 TaxID=1917165 RepID=UPI000970FBAF|nr:hypothetical protein [Colwellia sp. UCD-KL20]
MWFAVEKTTFPTHRKTSYKSLLTKWHTLLPLIFLIFTFISSSISASSINPLSSYVKPQNILQDNNGYIWFGGQAGLSRFDGVNIISFSSQSAQWNIPFTWIHDITSEGDNFIVSTESHQLWKFNPTTRKTSQVGINLPSKTIYNAIIFKGKYYLNIPKDIYQYTPSTKSTTLIAEDIDITYFEKTTKNLYAAGRDGLFKYENNTFSPIVNENIYQVATNENGILVITKNNILYIDDSGHRQTIPNSDKLIISTKTNDGNFILLNKAGSIVKLSANNLAKMEHDYPDIEQLIAKDIMQDSANTLWISSNKGIKTISPSPIKNHPKIYDVATNANESVLFNNDILIGSYGDGIHVFNNKRSTISSEINSFLTPLAKKTMDLLAINDDLYIATFDGLWVYNLLDKEVKKVDFIFNNKLLLKITKNQNLLYIATNYDGFYIYNLLTKHIIEHIDVDNGISSSEIIDIMTLDNHKIWLATAKGIDIYNRYTKVNQHIDLPGTSKVISFAVLNNKVYAATKGDGLFVLNFHGDILSRLGVGIDFSMISVINNEIWAPAQQGLYRINTKDNTISLVPNTEQYTFTDSPIKHKGNVYIPHYGGMLEVPLTDIKKYNARVSISEITISGQTSLTNKNINVNSENDVISFSLASLDFRSGKPKKFKYQINNGDWNDVYGNQLTLTGLRSGTYKLIIKGTNSLGQWSDIHAFAEINVAYPWYLTPQMKKFYLFSLSILLIITAWLLYLRFKSIRHIHAILSNDIRMHGKISFNVERNLSQAKELLSINFDDFTPARLHQVSQIVHECLESLSKSDNDNELNSIRGKSLEVALPYFVNYIHEKYHSNIDLQIDIPESRLSHEMQADMYKIIYETIVSTIINGNGRNFEITIQEFKQKIWLTISNDENGFSKFKNKINFDISMYYIRQIASKYNASFNVFDKENSGSQLIISIPLMDIS